MKLANICVYCGSSEGVDPDYSAAAAAFGRMLAEAGIRLIYGGGSIGLMGVLARSVLESGGKVVGVIPEFLKDREVMLREASTLLVTADMHERKRVMFENSDAFVALPGGIGTLEETVEMMTWAQLGRHAKPVVLANIKGFWDPLVALFRHMDAQGFVRQTPLADRMADPYVVVEGIEPVLPTLHRLLDQAADADFGASDTARLM